MEKNSSIKNIKIWGTATVGSKGQVVIPAKAREEFDIQDGDQLLTISPHNKAAIVMVKAYDLEQILTKMQGHIEMALNNLSKTKLKGDK